MQITDVKLKCRHIQLHITENRLVIRERMECINIHTFAHLEFANFLIAWTQDGKFKNKQVFKRNAVQLLTPDETNLGYYAWFLRGTNKGELIYNHTGGDAGVMSFIAFNPKTKKGILFMMNSYLESREAYIKLINIFYYGTL